MQPALIRSVTAVCLTVVMLLARVAAAQQVDHSMAGEGNLIGAATCAAAACHGSPQPGVALANLVRGSEYPLWQERDPHARSWRTLCSEESNEMLRRLGILRNGEIADVAGLNNCMACHNTQPWPDNARATGFSGEGVGCESCHGPARQWISTHTLGTWSPEAAPDFRNTDDLLVRARVCAGCHVGDASRDMNHDIIAAGHPALRFDFATYHNRLPKHWREPAADSPTYESRLWLAGVIGQAEASLELALSRAEGSLYVSQWPELANYDCASCHHSLDLANERDPVGQFARPSAPRAAAFHTATLRGLLELIRDGGAADSPASALLASLQRLDAIYESSYAADRDAVRAAVQEAQVRLDQWKEAVRARGLLRSFNAEDLAGVVATMSQSPESSATWENAAALYLAAVAARDYWQRSDAAGARPMNVLHRLRRGLGYPEDQNSPKYLVRESTGATLQRADVHELFRSLTVHFRAAEGFAPQDRELESGREVLPHPDL